MERWTIIAIVAAAVAVVLLLVLVATVAKSRRAGKQTTMLREGFGPEYSKAVEDQGRAGAEADLLKRQQRADLFQVRSLSAIEIERYTESWSAVQAQFVDDPGAALAAADHLAAEVIAARGYPAAEFEQSTSALSVDHPRAVQDYRSAHEVAMRNQRNPVSTDDLRAAMVQYRAVFTEMLGGVAGTPVPAT